MSQSHQSKQINSDSIQSKKNYQSCFDREMALMKDYEYKLNQCILTSQQPYNRFDFHADAMRGIVMAWEKIASHFDKFEHIPAEIIETVDGLFSRMVKHREECMKVLISASR